MKPNTVNKARNSIEMPAQAFLRLATIVRAAKGGEFLGSRIARHSRPDGAETTRKPTHENGLERQLRGRRPARADKF
ncbi:hypothetical protein [Burkholderia stagnalis]|uniref:hypothetical protein n=1 Tax=Burkholderia stagnalis TaxID=1503054 RepID=UPI000F803F10|nr:hypothetical protein [Burkholderia stagnalis]